MPRQRLRREVCLWKVSAYAGGRVCEYVKYA